jgi:hypothetical protein
MFKFWARLGSYLCTFTIIVFRLFGLHPDDDALSFFRPLSAIISGAPCRKYKTEDTKESKKPRHTNDRKITFIVLVPAFCETNKDNRYGDQFFGTLCTLRSSKVSTKKLL